MRDTIFLKKFKSQYEFIRFYLRRLLSIDQQQWSCLSSELRMCVSDPYNIPLFRNTKPISLPINLRKQFNILLNGVDDKESESFKIAFYIMIFVFSNQHLRFFQESDNEKVSVFLSSLYDFLTSSSLFNQSVVIYKLNLAFKRLLYSQGIYEKLEPIISEPCSLSDDLIFIQEYSSNNKISEENICYIINTLTVYNALIEKDCFYDAQINNLLKRNQNLDYINEYINTFLFYSWVYQCQNWFLLLCFLIKKNNNLQECFYIFFKNLIPFTGSYKTLSRCENDFECMFNTFIDSPVKEVKYKKILSIAFDLVDCLKGDSCLQAEAIFEFFKIVQKIFSTDFGCFDNDLCDYKDSKLCFYSHATYMVLRIIEYFIDIQKSYQSSSFDIVKHLSKLNCVVQSDTKHRWNYFLLGLSLMMQKIPSEGKCLCFPTYLNQAHDNFRTKGLNTIFSDLKLNWFCNPESVAYFLQRLFGNCTDDNIKFYVVYLSNSIFKIRNFSNGPLLRCVFELILKILPIITHNRFAGFEKNTIQVIGGFINQICVLLKCQNKSSSEMKMKFCEFFMMVSKCFDQRFDDYSKAEELSRIIYRYVNCFIYEKFNFLSFRLDILEQKIIREEAKTEKIEQKKPKDCTLDFLDKVLPVVDTQWVN